MDWTGLENRLAQTIGLEASTLGSTVFRQSVGRRMRARGTEALREYMKLLDSDGVEFQALVEELVVLESWFFRHAHAFELLRRHATATMVARQKPYRVLSFPCAGGEEPYSIVMALREAGLGFHQFQVDAADISETAVQKASGGKYGMRSVRVVAPAIQGRYFRINDQSVEVLPEIRRAVRFIRANIIDAQSAFQGDKYDAVFCRNLLIYLTPAVRHRVLQAVSGWLSPSGLFFVGHAEMLREFAELFEPVPERGAFAYCRLSGTQAARSEQPPVFTERSRSGDQEAVLAYPPSVQRTSKSGSVNHTETAAPGASLPNQNSEHTPRVVFGSTSREVLFDGLVSQVSALSSAVRHPEAIEVCQHHLRKNGPSPRVYHLLGMIFQAAGLYDEAEQALERAVYLDPEHEESLLSLALIAQRRRGDAQIADRFEQRSQRAHHRRQPT